MINKVCLTTNKNNPCADLLDDGTTILQDDTNFKLSYFKRYINVNTFNYQFLSINLAAY